MKISTSLCLALMVFCLGYSEIASGQCEPVLNIANDDNSVICSGESFDIIINPGTCDDPGDYEYSWSDGTNTIDTDIPTLTVPGILNSGDEDLEITYTVTVIDADATEIGSDDLVVIILTEPVVTILVDSSSDPLCEGNDITLQAIYSGGSENPMTAVWSGVDQENGLEAVDENVMEGTEYGIVVTDDEGCVAETDQIEFDINPIPGPISIDGDTGYCVGDEMVLSFDDGGGNFDCAWQKDGSNAPSNNCELVRDPVQSSDAGTYMVTVTDNSTQCVSNPETVQVIVDNLDININPEVDPDGICLNAPPVDLNLSPAPGSLENPSLTSDPDAGSALNGGNFSPADAGVGTFTITYQGTLGFCTDSDIATITVLPVPDVEVSAISPVCNFNSNLDLNEFASPEGGVFTYSNGEVFSGVFTPVDTTDNISLVFEYTYTDPVTGCFSTEPGLVQINSELQLIMEDDLNTCFGSGLPLGTFPSGGGGIYSYSWSNENLLENSMVQFPELLENVPVGSYNFELTVTDQNNCLVSDNQAVSVAAQPSVTITSEPAVFCEGDSILLSAEFTGGVGQPDYFWENDNITQNQPGTFQTGPLDEEENFAVIISFDPETGCPNASFDSTFTPVPLVEPSIVSVPGMGTNVVCSKQFSVYFAENRVPGTQLIWSLQSENANVDSTVRDDELFYVYWAENLSGTETIFLEEFVSDECQGLDQLEVEFSQDQAPEPAEIYFSELNGILFYNRSGLCYRWGFIDPNANLNASPPESYLNFDLDENQYQSFIVGDLDTTLTYVCQTWIPGGCEDPENSCSNTVLYSGKNLESTPSDLQAKIEFKVFPNPNTGNFNLQVEDLIADKHYSWELRNPLGQITDSGSFVTNDSDHIESISILNHAKGIYLLSISDGANVLKVSRVSIQN